MEMEGGRGENEERREGGGDGGERGEDGGGEIERRKEWIWYKIRSREVRGRGEMKEGGSR